MNYDEYPRDWSLPKNVPYDDFVYGQVLSELPTSGVVLDYGCGTGTLSLWMKSRGANVIPVDISERAQRMARDVAGCWDGIPDTLVMVHVLEHMDDEYSWPMNAQIKNMIIICPTIFSFVYRLNVFMFGKFKHDERVGHLRRYDLNRLSFLCEKLGYKIEKVVYMDSLLRDLIFFQWPFVHLKFVFNKPLVRRIFNRVDGWLANHKFLPASICIHAKKY